MRVDGWRCSARTLGQQLLSSPSLFKEKKVSGNWSIIPRLIVRVDFDFFSIAQIPLFTLLNKLPIAFAFLAQLPKDSTQCFQNAPSNGFVCCSFITVE